MPRLPDQMKARSGKRRTCAAGQKKGGAHACVQRSGRTLGSFKMQERPADHDLLAEDKRTRKVARAARINPLVLHQTANRGREKLPEAVQDPS